MKIFEVARMEEILVDILGEPKCRCEGDVEKQIQFNCPVCTEENNGIPDGKYNLEFTFGKALKSGGLFQCWRCSSYDETMKGSGFNLVKRFGTRDQYREYKRLVKEIYESKLYDYFLSTAITDSANATKTIELPSTFKHLVINECEDKKLLEYIEKRQITQEMADRFSLGYTSREESDWTMRNRIIIPSYDSFGDLNYYVGRDFVGKTRMKYKNCNVDKKSVIFQESLINWDSTIYLCEGVFDAMRFPSNGVSMLGKVLTSDTYLFHEIVTKANADVVIVLDGDTQEIETKKIYKLLNFGRLQGKIEYIDLYNGISNYKDMSEIFEHEGKRGVVNVLRQAKQYSEIDLIY
jgi:DNA primase